MGIVEDGWVEKIKINIHHSPVELELVSLTIRGGGFYRWRNTRTLEMLNEKGIEDEPGGYIGTEVYTGNARNFVVNKEKNIGEEQGQYRKTISLEGI